MPSNDLNKVILIGRLTRDAELKYNTSRRRSTAGWEQFGKSEQLDWGKYAAERRPCYQSGKHTTVYASPAAGAKHTAGNVFFRRLPGRHSVLIGGYYVYTCRNIKTIF